jgi:hypothetical protein
MAKTPLAACSTKYIFKNLHHESALVDRRPPALTLLQQGANASPLALMHQYLYR